MLVLYVVLYVEHNNESFIYCVAPPEWHISLPRCDNIKPDIQACVITKIYIVLSELQRLICHFNECYSLSGRYDPSALKARDD